MLYRLVRAIYAADRRYHADRNGDDGAQALRDYNAAYRALCAAIRTTQNMMSASFQNALNQTLKNEGLLSNDPDDSGGLTKYGITHRTWAAYCAKLRPGDARSVDEITLNDAHAVYAYGYWTPLGLDSITDPEVAAEIFDTAVNCGIGTAAKIAQLAYNLVRKDGTQPLATDGQIGPITRAAINGLTRSGYRLPMLAALNFYQASHYAAIVERNPSQRKFIRGWMKRTLRNG